MVNQLMVYVEFHESDKRSSVEEELQILERQGYIRTTLAIFGDVRRWTLIKIGERK